MAETYLDAKASERRQIRKQLVRTPVVQAGLKKAATSLAIDARGFLNARADTGAAQILTMSARVDGWVDSYVVLDDSRGLDAAISIEFGAHNNPDPPAPLRRAMGIAPGNLVKIKGK